MTQAVIQTTVTGMQGRPIATTVPAANQAYTWSGTAWAPTGPYLPLAGGILTGPLRLQYNTPNQLFNDTATSITAGGLWRESITGGTFFLQSNTATAGDFSTAVTGLSVNPTSGNVNIGGALGVSGSANIAAGLSVSGGIDGNAMIRSLAGRIMAQSGSPGVCCFLPSAGQCCGFWNTGGSNLMLFDRFDSSGNPLNQPFGYFTTGNDLVIGGSLIQGSSAEAKTNINPITQGISLIRQLTPKSFAWQATPSVIHWGFIAQDVETVIPTAVVEGEFAGATQLSLDTTAVLAAVTYAVKQLDQRCAALETAANITPTAGELA